MAIFNDKKALRKEILTKRSILDAVEKEENKKN